MASEDKDNSDKKITATDIIKFVSAVGVIIPLFLGYWQYKASVQGTIDNNFRTVVEKLSSSIKEERLASATSLGTFVNKDSPYYHQAVDILINATSKELESSVLHAIKGSLERVAVEDYKMVIQKLLDIERSLFIYDYPLRNWLEKSERQYNEKFRYVESIFEDHAKKGFGKDASPFRSTLEQEILEQWRRKNSIELQYHNIEVHRSLITNFLTIFLGLSRNMEISMLSFYRNSFNYVVLTNINLPNSFIDRSAISWSTISRANFSHATIIDTTFVGTNIEDSDFSNSIISGSDFSRTKLIDVNFQNSQFTETFFIGADVKDTDFSSTTGLKPEFFYKTKNLDKAIFDDDFRIALANLEFSGSDILSYIENSSLSDLRKKELMEFISALK